MVSFIVVSERLREIESRSFPWQGKIIAVIRQPHDVNFTILCAEGQTRTDI